MKKIIITGTGRCGTTFLMRLFTDLGFNTGYTNEQADWTVELGKCDGGIEHGFPSESFDNSKIVKNPDFLGRIQDLIPYARHVIICIRSIDSVIKSRSYQSKGNDKNPEGYGGLVTGNEEDEKRMYFSALYHAIEKLTENDVKFTILNFPKIVNDKDYLFNKLNKIVKLEYSKFEESFEKVADKTKINF